MGQKFLSLLAFFFCPAQSKTNFLLSIFTDEISNPTGQPILL